MVADEKLPFAEVLRRFQGTLGEARYRGLVLVGTGQPQTAALLIGALNPERVAILLTDFTRNSQFPTHVAALLHEAAPVTGPLRCAPEAWLMPGGNHESTIDVYQGLRRVLDAWGDLPLSAIAVDLTGGKSTMTVGLSKAAHVLGLPAIYVNVSEYINNRPRDGTQFLDTPPDPYVVFGDLEAREGRRLFNGHDYVSANRLFSDLAARVVGEDGELYGACALLARAYACWEGFDVGDAAHHLAILLAHPVPRRLEAHRDMLATQLAALQQLVADERILRQRNGPTLAFLRDLDRVLPLLGSLHRNALRRVAQHRFDMAALLHYRCLELISQQRLAGYGILTEKPDYHEARRCCPDLDQRYAAVEWQIFHSSRGLPRPQSGIALFNGYMLLEALADPLIAEYAISVIKDRSAARNQSLLAHGFRSITEQEYNDFSIVVEELLTRFFMVSGRDRAAWERTCRFITLE